MPRQLGPRFALEAAFLILVAVGAGLLDLRPLLIVLVMGIAWLLVALMEYAASREAPYFGPRMPTPVFGRVVEEAPVVESEVVRERPTLLEPAPSQAVPPAPEAGSGAAERVPAESEPELEPEAPTEISQPRAEVPPAAPEPRAGEPGEAVETGEEAAAEPSGFATSERPPMKYRLEPLEPRAKRRFWQRARSSEEASSDSSSGDAAGEPGDES